MSLSKVIEVARGELGYTETPVNRTKYWEDYDKSFQGQPWGVAFLWWVFNQAGERMAFFGGGKTASCSMLLRWYKEQGLTVPVSEVQVGDIVLLNFHGGKDPEHCGLVAEVLGNGWYIQTIEGNTTNTDKNTSNDSNGGCVAAKTRYPSQIIGVCRPQYKADDPQPVDDVSGHWAAEDVRWAEKMKLMKGYPDGSFKPDAPITRAEEAVILHRFYNLIRGEDDLK